MHFVELNGSLFCPIEELPTLIRIARRGRRFAEVAEEAGIAETTLRKAEAGEDISLPSLRKIADWIQTGIIVGPRNGATPATDWTPPVIDTTPEKDSTYPDIEVLEGGDHVH